MITRKSMAARNDCNLLKLRQTDANLIMRIWSRLNYEMGNIEWTSAHVLRALVSFKRQLHFWFCLSSISLVFGISRAPKLSYLQPKRSHEARQTY